MRRKTSRQWWQNERIRKSRRHECWAGCRCRTEWGQFYNNQQNPYIRFDFEGVDIFSFDNWLKGGCVYKRIEKPWWEEFKGAAVMRSQNEIFWALDVFIQHDSEESKYRFVCHSGKYRHIRPLTTAERDAITVRD